MTGPFHVDAGSATPPYEQLKEQISEGRRSGALAPGHRLPPVRRLAEDVGVAPNTVARAYRELEKAGVIETRGRGGSFVTPPDAARHERVRQAARAYLATAREHGLGIPEALRLLDEEAATAEGSVSEG